jgi:hypothetical protein
MRTQTLVFVVCGLLLVTGASSAVADGGDEAKVADYVKALKSKNAAVRKQVALALGDLGEKARSAVPALREALRDNDDGVKEAAATALEKINGSTAGERRNEEIDQLKKLVKEKDEALVKALEREKKAEEARVAADIEKKSLQAQNERLVRQLEELTKEMAKLRKDRAAAAAPNRPPKDLEGIVMEVEEKNGLVKISVGSDSGLEKGHTLDVYRLKPAPKYLGQIEIVEVTATSAVAKPVGKSRETIQKGDSVSSGLPKK